ncbi:MAG: hypothetical protein M1837_005272, partial [Sclerophora amabilis]
ARTLLTALVDTPDSPVPFPTLTFNLCTIYELCSEKSRALKLGLAEKIATEWAETYVGSGGNDEMVAGDRRKGWRGWREMSNADFKL